jgi:hypothetical protein
METERFFIRSQRIHAKRLVQFKDIAYHGVEPPTRTNPDIVFHAKVYVFATLYLSRSLRRHCLKLLHRDVSNMKLAHVNTSQIIDLVEFIYRETSSEDVDGPSPMRPLSCGTILAMENQ